ncbi:MAG: DOMON domain-containing protein [Candidatus Hermodarchaeota archaeon]
MSWQKNAFLLRLKFILVFFLVCLSVFTLANSSMTQGQTNIIDGTIADGEYQFNGTLGNGDFTLYWHTVADEIYVGMVGKTTGWVSLGISPTFMMENADMIIGFVTTAGDTEILDAYSTGATGPHPLDIDLGGTTDISEYNGTEASNLTTIEFKRQLITNDDYDKPFSSGTTITIIWGLGSGDDFDAPHFKRGSASFNLESGIITDKTSTTPTTTVTTTIPVEVFLLGLLSLTLILWRRRKS